MEKRGFTIVELLIVIVVIAILSAIGIVAYSGVQARAQDAIIRQGAGEVAKALMHWHTLTGKTTLSGGYNSTQPLDPGGSCSDGSGVGWIARGTYACALEEELAYHRLLPAGFVRNLPANKAYLSSASNGNYTVMIYPCVVADGTWAVLYHLNNPSAEDVASYDNLISRCPDGNLTHRRSTYRMQGGLVVTLK